MSVKPIYARPMDLHSHTSGCDSMRSDGTTYCKQVYAAADYDALLLHLTQLKESVKKARIELEGVGQESSKEFHRIGIDSALGILRAAVSNTSGS
jgi:hypothetical protein